MEPERSVSVLRSVLDKHSEMHVKFKPVLDLMYTTPVVNAPKETK